MQTEHSAHDISETGSAGKDLRTEIVFSPGCYFSRTVDASFYVTAYLYHDGNCREGPVTVRKKVWQSALIPPPLWVQQPGPVHGILPLRAWRQYQIIVGREGVELKGKYDCFQIFPTFHTTRNSVVHSPSLNGSEVFRASSVLRLQPTASGRLVTVSETIPVIYCRAFILSHQGQDPMGPAPKGLTIRPSEYTQGLFPLGRCRQDRCGRK